LPGYYFDPEKKRYFRLLPGHNNCNPLTKESIRQKEMESKRLQLLEEEDKQGKKIARLGFNASSLLQKSKLGFLNVTSYCRLAHELRVSCMQRKKVQIQSSDPSALASDRFNLILADTNSDRLFTVNDVKVGGSKYGIINLHGLKTPTLRVHMHENLYFTNRKVNAVSWASLNHLDSHILYLLAGEGRGLLFQAVPHGNCRDSRLCHPAPSVIVSGDRPGMLCSFRIPGAWSCAWSLNIQANNCFSTGELRLPPQVPRVKDFTDPKPLSTVPLPSPRAPLLFNGCRSGEIFAIDLRCRNQGKGWKATRLFHDSAVTSVQILQEEQCLMASDMAGTIKLWDLRTTKCIRQYEGHVNEYAHLPLHVHEEEGIVWARTATRESGASMMPSCSEPYPPHTPLPRPTFPVWPSLLGLGASGERQGCSWPSGRTFTASPTANSAGCSLEGHACDSAEHSHWYCTSGEEPLPLFCTISTVETTDYSEYLPSKQMRRVAQTGYQKCPQSNARCPPTRAPRDKVSPTYLSALDLTWSKSSM
ncbi:hypothetical protein E2I00_012727, partial [Balaenoptera physalus]